MKINRPHFFFKLSICSQISGAFEEWLHSQEATLYSHCSAAAPVLVPQGILVSHLLHTVSKERESHSSPALDRALVLFLACCGNGAGELQLFSLVSVAHEVSVPCRGTCLCLCKDTKRGCSRGTWQEPLFLRGHLAELPCIRVHQSK